MGGKTLDATVYAQAGSCDQAAKWLTDQLVPGIDDLSSELLAVWRSSSEAWPKGPASEIFRADLVETHGDSTEIRREAKAIGDALSDFAEAIRKVTSNILKAREHGRTGGLQITEGEKKVVIHPPKHTMQFDESVPSDLPQPPPHPPGEVTVAVREYQDRLAEDSRNNALAYRENLAYEGARHALELARNVEVEAYEALGPKLKQSATAMAMLNTWITYAKNGVLQPIATVEDVGNAYADRAKGYLAIANSFALKADELDGVAKLSEKLSMGEPLNKADQTKIAAWQVYVDKLRKPGAGGDDYTKLSSADLTRAKRIDDLLGKVPKSLRPSHNVTELAGGLAYETGARHKDTSGSRKGLSRPRQVVLKLADAKPGKILRGVPVLGTSLDVAAGAADVASGKDPKRVIVRTVASTLGGMAGGAAVSSRVPLPHPVAKALVVAVGSIAGGFTGGELVDTAWPEDSDFDKHVYLDRP